MTVPGVEQVFSSFLLWLIESCDDENDGGVTVTGISY